jgi:hypothetical protein
MEIEELLPNEEYFDIYDLEFASPIYEDLKRGFFNESKHTKCISRSSKKNKIQRNIPRNQTHFLCIKKTEIRREYLLDQHTREKENFLKKNASIKYHGAIAPIIPSASYSTPTPVPLRTPVVTPTFTAPNSQYERELQEALKTSVAEKHDSGLSFQMLLDFSSRELTPEDYEMLLMLDTVIEKKTTSDSVLKSLNDSVINESTVGGDCPICVCSFELEEKVITLNCSHVFHDCCITEWLTKHSQTCPLCNATVMC